MNPETKAGIGQPSKQSLTPRLASPSVWAKRLEARCIKIIGLGGIGSWVAQALVPFLASIRAPCTLWLIDGDSFEESNRGRALFESVGQKALIKAAELSAIAPSGLTIVPIPRYVTPRNVRRLIEPRDIVLLCVDNHRTRKCVSDAARKLPDVLLISGGNDGVESPSAGAFGNVIAYCKRNGRDLTNPLTQFHAEIARPRDKAPHEMSCAELARASAPQLLFTNLQVATSMLCAFLAWLNHRLDYEEIYLDILMAKVMPVSRRVANPSLRRK